MPPVSPQRLSCEQLWHDPHCSDAVEPGSLWAGPQVIESQACTGLSLLCHLPPTPHPCLSCSYPPLPSFYSPSASVLHPGLDRPDLALHSWGYLSYSCVHTYPFDPTAQLSRVSCGSGGGGKGQGQSHPIGWTHDYTLGPISSLKSSTITVRKEGLASPTPPPPAISWSLSTEKEGPKPGHFQMLPSGATPLCGFSFARTRK